MNWNIKSQKKLIDRYLLAQIGKKLFGQEAYLRISNQFDPVILRANKY